MNEAAIGMVLASAVLHSAWNYVAKRSSNQLVFLWLAVAAGLVIFTPAFLIVIRDSPIPRSGWVFISLSSVVHVLYFVLLGGAYSRTDLSIVYPLARGTGPIFVLILSVVFLRELPTLLGLLGILIVILGVYLVQARKLTVHALGAPVRGLLSSGSRWALLTGLSIGVYSIVDSAGVQHVHPIAYMYLWVAGTIVIMAPWMLARFPVVRHVARREAGWILAAGGLLFGAYVLVLTAMTTSSVSYVSAARETSIVLAAVYGGILLREGFGSTRILGAGFVASGVALIGVAG
jgi:drug/metabolite transporter (DMT)-like permease